METCFVYVFLSRIYPTLKVGQSGDPYGRLYSLCNAWEKFFDLERSFTIEVATRRLARSIERDWKAALKSWAFDSDEFTIRHPWINWGCAGRKEWFSDNCYDELLARAQIVRNQIGTRSFRLGVRAPLNASTWDVARRHAYSVGYQPEPPPEPLKPLSKDGALQPLADFISGFPSTQGAARRDAYYKIQDSLGLLVDAGYSRNALVNHLSKNASWIGRHVRISKMPDVLREAANTFQTEDFTTLVDLSEVYKTAPDVVHHLLKVASFVSASVAKKLRVHLQQRQMIGEWWSGKKLVDDLYSDWLRETTQDDEFIR